ncbi:response regulator transcription factor [Pontibacter actiniarum]|uniref:Response regulator n=1 Tax=Pontibacter actiniarum TaxID=323450 RepID=A0A1X9YNE5_9BACT|nr:response regulator [Pontibacter actiniarum]ARS34341.1 response regulator [Pontibacter actiniarum]
MKKILLVDDMEIFNFIMVTSIKNVDPACVVHDFTNPLLAFSALQELDPHVVFLDLNMPELDGWGFLEKMQEQNLRQKVYILTSSTSELDRQRSEAYPNVVRFLVKPVEEELLEEILREGELV